MLTAIVLTVLAVSFRLLASSLQIWNFAPLGAVSLFAGSRLPRQWAWVVPVAAMAISDHLIDHDRYRPLFELTRWTIYATLAATTLLGRFANSPRFGRWLLPVLSLSGSTLFFLTSNLATWGEGLLYPMTFSGLISCFVGRCLSSGIRSRPIWRARRCCSVWGPSSSEPVSPRDGASAGRDHQ